jgi:tetratricopeptide (TPR) repeat protein
VWAQEQLGLNRLGYDGTRNLAGTYSCFEKYEQAIEIFKDACSMQTDNWRAHWDLARTYRYQNNWTLAIQTLEAVIKSIESGQAKTSDPKTELPQMRCTLAWWNKAARNYDKAREIYEMILSESPEDYPSTFQYICILRETGDYAKMLELLQKMKGTIDEETKLDRWTSFYHVYAWYSQYHDTMISAAAEREIFDLVKEGYQNAIETAKLKRAADGLVEILLYYSILFTYSHQDDEDEKIGTIRQLEEILHSKEGTSSPNSNLPRVKQLVVRKLLQL